MNAEKTNFLQKVLKLQCWPSAISYNLLQNLPEQIHNSKNRCCKCRNFAQYRNVLRVYKKRPVKKWILKKICSICNQKINQKVLTNKKLQHKNKPQAITSKTKTITANKNKSKVKTNIKKILKKTQKVKRAKQKALKTNLVNLATKAKSSKSLLKQFMDSVTKI